MEIYLEQGKYCDPQPEKAFPYYQKAASQGYPEGEYFLGLAYEQGQVIKQDYSQAMQYYKLASKDYAPALTRIGIMYKEGKGEAIDHIKAMHYFHEAIEMDHEPGALYQYAYVLKKDIVI